ncbi:MAG: HAD-IIIC family phosphatase [Kiritimatiellae bacterium]|nr:HAD-IIIC family phosphatase [Kiritimatiellia bacterium]
MKIALIGDVTLDPLAAMLRERGFGVWTPPGFGAWRQTPLSPPQDLLAFAPEAAFAILSQPGALRARPPFPVFFPDLDALAEECAPAAFRDERFAALASMPFSLAGLRAIAAEVQRLCRFLPSAGEDRLSIKKVLALDFDGVLWDGVAGEDGAGAIEPRAEFQRRAKALKERGVPLVALSANNESDTAEAWNAPGMVLGPGDFAAMRVNWLPKHENLVSVAKELNLGVDSFVFVDDNPAERAKMRAALPDVAVPDTLDLRRIERMYFPEMLSTDEDLRRSAQYREESARRQAAAGLTLDGWLASLEIENDIHPALPDEVARIAQLSQKCNQFNVRTNRYSHAEVAAFQCDASRLLAAVRTRDKFGDMGLVAFVNVAISGGEAFIEDWVMSCRAMNRRIEFAVEEHIERVLRSRGVGILRAEWLKTPKNAPVERLFDDFGFTLGVSSPDAKRYSKPLPAV